MFHYEIIILIKNIKIEKIINIINYYKNLIISKKGKIHRFENWGFKKLTYIIKNQLKAFYILMNIEISKKNIIKINHDLNINDNIIRILLIKKKKKITQESLIYKNIKINKKKLK